MHQARFFLQIKVETFLIILRIYNCLKLPFNVTLLEYLSSPFIFIFFLIRPALIAVFFLKLM